MILRHRLMQRRTVRVVGDGEQARDVETARLPVVNSNTRVDALDVPDCLGDRAIAKQREILAHFLRDVFEEVHDELGLAAESLAQLGVLRGDAHRAGVEMADAHHDATAHHKRCSGKAELFGAEQCRDDDVATGLHLAVGLHHDAVAQTVQQERLLGFGEAQFPRGAGVLQRCER